MANLQIKGVDEDFYQELKRMAAAGHRTAVRILADLLDPEELKHAVMSRAGHDKHHAQTDETVPQNPPI
ncbi:MAG: hypothetical protein HGB12_11770, partial [Bacteroidetes bacterium]|nr:hypothetical protein [Bacteroidota bacterium]